ncbi:MAG: tetratricopeptide repeat protein, partial [Lachnospiraceae bacterium]|nr:tetratricopeptide repeat protein [Lachnospiraceae bacterium]
MKCYNCGRTLSEDDFCTACGADVKMYKQILFLADAFYNEGLAKARVRDLSGAAASLRDSLKCNKRHVKARNLLGLVYFEMGETVAALSEWLISLDIRPKKNVASDFMKSVQSNPARLNLLDQSIKKYNQGLSYAHRGDLDLAKIQLKKVVSMNQNYIRAFELLTLLFLNDEEWDRAKHTAERALRVDSNNTKLLSYLQEANRQLSLKDAASGRKGRKQKEESFTYQSGNETIIQPLNGPDKAGRFSILYIILGLVLGIGIMWFLVVPSRIKEGRSDVNEQIKRVSEELTTRNAEMEDMTRKLEALEKEKQAREQELESFTGESGVIGNYDNLLKAAESYITDPEDALTAAGYLEAIGNPEDFNEEFGVLYGLLSEHVSAKAAETYFKSGTDKYNDGDYTGAIEDLTRVVDLD